MFNVNSNKNFVENDTLTCKIFEIYGCFLCTYWNSKSGQRRRPCSEVEHLAELKKAEEKFYGGLL